MTTNRRNSNTITMISNKNINSNIPIYMSTSEFPKNEIRPTNGITMKKLFTIKFRVTNNNSVNNGGGRSNNIMSGGRSKKPRVRVRGQ